MKNILPAIIFICSSLASYSQQTSNDTIHWSELRKLEWKDFTGKAANENGVTGQATMLMNAKFHKGLKATTRVETIFSKKLSFASADGKTGQQLKYYQTMFDLYETESRKLRKQFKETKFGLDPDKVFQEKYSAALKTLNERVDLYMEETETGSNVKELEKWSKNLQKELKDLESSGK